MAFRRLRTYAQLKEEASHKEIASSVFSADTLGNTASQVESNGEPVQGELAFLFESGFQLGNGTVYEPGFPGGVSSGNSIALGAGSIERLAGLALPRTRRSRTERAYQHYETDDLLQELIDIKTEFTTAGFSFQACAFAGQNPNEAVQAELADFQASLDELCLMMDFSKLVEDLVNDWYISDSMILYWRTDAPGINAEGLQSEDSVPDEKLEEGWIPGLHEICALNPKEVDWVNSMGRDFLLVDVSRQVVDTINNAFTNGRKEKKTDQEIIAALQASGIHFKWINAVLKGEKQVVLREEDGDHWLICTKARQYHGLAAPSMYTIFLSLEARGLLTQGDFATAFMMKHFIMLIKQGESIKTGPLQGSTKNWMKQKDAKNLLSQFSVVSKAIRAAVNHTTTIQFVFPPKEMFDPERFASVEHRIYNWVGVTIVLNTGTGAEYAGGYLSIKKLVSKIEKTREKVGCIFTKFFRHPSIRSRLKQPQASYVQANFDFNVLKEPKLLLDEVKWLFEESITDQRTAARELGRDPEQLKTSTLQSRKEEETLQVWSGVGPQGQKKSSGPEGRPANEDTSISEETRTQYPAGRVPQ
jgi:hypothetical protein